MKICPNCKKRVEDDANFCGYCSKQIPLNASIVADECLEAASEDTAQRASLGAGAKEKRYPALKVIVGYYNILANLIIGVTALICVALVFGGYKSNTLFFSILISIGVLVIGAVLSITMRAMAEGISVFLDIEANTRKVARI